MNKYWKRLTFNIVFAIVLILCSYCYLDEKIALKMNSILTANDQLAAITDDIPDILFLMVCMITGAAWFVYFYNVQKDITNTHTHFSLHLANAVPLSFLLKSILQFIIGRSSTRHWLHSPSIREFQWFHEGGFPSGHMAVFMVVVLAVWTYYPRYRLVSGAFLLSLALALIATDYHFLSDVIAGVYLGWGVHYFAVRGIASLPGLGEGNSVIYRSANH